MSKRIPLDMNQFKVELPSQPRDPLDSLIPTAPPPDDLTESVPFKDTQVAQESRRKSSTPVLQKSSSPGVQQSRTPVVQQSITAEGGSFSDYPLVSYQAMKKLDAYLRDCQIKWIYEDYGIESILPR